MVSERIMSLLSIIELKSPDVICMQEVLKDVQQTLLYALYTLGYKYFFPESININYDCIIVSKHPIKKTKEYPYEFSDMGRNLKITVIEHINTKQLFVISTTHFESAFKKTSENSIKISQYAEAEKILNKLSTHYKHIIIGCDTNILSHEEQHLMTNKSPDIWKDSWVENGSDGSKKFTYDTFTNDHVKNKNYNFNIRNRLDRIMYKGDIDTIDFELIKKSPNNNCVQPSDHHGIFAILQLKN
jgi:exonuclease III